MTRTLPYFRTWYNGSYTMMVKPIKTQSNLGNLITEEELML